MLEKFYQPKLFLVLYGIFQLTLKQELKNALKLKLYPVVLNPKKNYRTLKDALMNATDRGKAAISNSVNSLCTCS